MTFNFRHKNYTPLFAMALGAFTSSLSASPSMSAPQLTISGQSTFNAWWFENKQQKYRNDSDFGQGFALGQIFGPGQGLPLDNSQMRGYGRGYLFTMDDSRLKFDVSGKTDPGMDYGFAVLVNTSTEQTSYDKTIKESYIWAGGSWGRLTFGNTDGVEDIMAFGGFDPLGGTGGFDGNFDRVVNFVTGTVTSIDLVGDTGKSTKVMYQTPRYYGFQGGISFTPQTGHQGEAKINSSRDYGKKGELNAFDRRSIAGGLNFLNKWNNGFELGLSGTAIFAKTQPEYTGDNWTLVDTDGQIVATNIGNNSGERKNTASFALGTMMRYAGFELGFEFGNNSRSGQIKDLQVETGGPKTNSGWFIDTGLAYSWGPTKFSIGYMYTKRKAMGLRGTFANGNLEFFKAKNRTNILSTSIDHKLAPGVGVYFEYAHYDMKNEGFNVDAMLHNSLNLAPAATPGVVVSATGGSFTGPVGPKQKSDAFVLGTKVKF
ncbi:Porin [Candidatus Bealeia paramacronuclearis]|uniref:Porin n=1 Tax=Candidatus Bealeia paramacronuclearis TaxID=1921001 RepID=A0ABZ2C6B5_9PROT|nr:Porin [Candidatus Bealeia paramacronuclearis]